MHLQKGLIYAGCVPILDDKEGEYACMHECRITCNIKLSLIADHKSYCVHCALVHKCHHAVHNVWWR